MRTARGKAAGRRKQRAYEILIAANQCRNQSPHFALTSRKSRDKAAAPSLAVFLSNCLRTRTITFRAHPAGNCRRNPSRTKRFARFRETARGAIRLATVTPSRETPARFFRAYTTNHVLLKTSAPGEKSNFSRRPIRRYRGNVSLLSVWLASDSNASASPSPARPDYCPAALGPHADQESVRALAFRYRWLICAFHDLSPVGSIQ